MILDAAYSNETMPNRVQTSESNVASASQNIPTKPSQIEDAVSVNKNKKTKSTMKEEKLLKSKEKVNKTKSERNVVLSDEEKEKRGVLIPTKIIGLLLIKNLVSKSKVQFKTNVLSLIQSYTGTTILKDGSSAKAAEQLDDSLVQESDVAGKGVDEAILFWVTGKVDSKVSVAAEGLERIVAGERINAVLKDLEDLFHKYVDLVVVWICC
jgi:hypothetical protein